MRADVKCRCRCLLFLAVVAVPVSVAAGDTSRADNPESRVGPAAFPEYAGIVDRGEGRPSHDAAMASAGGSKTARQIVRRLSAKWMDFSRCLQ